MTITPGKLLVAIDVAKRSHDVLVRWPEGRTRTFKVPSQREGFETLTTFLLEQGLKVRAAIEPTADYHRPLAYWLASKGIEVHLASSLACARVREAMFNSWDKNDRKDAGVIMYLLEHGMTAPFHDPLISGSHELQEISNTYQQVVMARSRCYHSLVNHYIQLYFPEIERFLHASRSEWLCRFLIRFPVPSVICSLTRGRFVKTAWKIAGRKVSKERLLDEIYELAQRSIGLPVDADSESVRMFRTQLERYLSLTTMRHEMEQRADMLLSEKPDYLRLKTLPGVGPVIALMILAESGDLRRFLHHKQYLNYCGFNLSAFQSGQSKSRYRLSKRGNARLRYAYWLAANGAILQRENSFRWKYEHYIRKDPNDADLKRKARTAVAAKMARVAHSLIKRESDYRGYHEAGLPGSGTQLVGP
jgi:transposase